MRFRDRAALLAGQAGVLFGWRPAEFWAATPAELAALLHAVAPATADPPDRALVTRLQEMFPDG